MAIQINKPITITQETITFDKFWLKALNIMSLNPNKSPRLIAQLEKVSIKEDGAFVTAPQNTPGARAVLNILDLNKEMATDTTTVTIKSPVTGQDITLYTADIILAVTEKVKQIAEAKNII